VNNGQKKRGNKFMKCNYCERRCELTEGETGICQMYHCIGGNIKEKYPNRYTTYMAVHIESIPFFHVYPGSRSLLIGSSGCNFNCHYCSNAHVAKGNPQELFMFEISPQRIVQIARKTGCHNIVFGVNEVTVSLPTIMKVAQCARAENIALGCLTNGYMTEDSCDMIAEAFQFVNVSLKSLSPNFYQKYVGVKDVQPIVRNIKRLAADCHVEITTPVIQLLNDHEIPDICGFIHSIDPHIPWHVFRLLPEYKMSEADYPNIDDISKSLLSAQKFLPHIYFGNFVGSEWINTLCPKCGSKVIERINMGGCGGKIINYHLNDGLCPTCGTKIPLHGKYVVWNSEDE
jgi:pyruvate formate lyase activating enzyme